MQNNLINYLPRWTKKIRTDGGGRDPLGLSKLSARFVDDLLCGITTTTNRARYYSFYTWSLWNIEQEEKLNNYDDLILAFRRREAVMALSTLSSDENSSMIGIEKVYENYTSGKSLGNFNCNFKVLPSNELGGYGQYYKGSLANLGLININDQKIDKVTDEGVNLAKLFHKTIKDTSYIRNKVFTQNSINIEDLENIKDKFSLNALSEDFAIEEVDLLKNIFFKSNPYNQNDFRKQTLILILNTTSEYSKYNSKPLFNDIDYYFVYPVYYYKTLWFQDNSVNRYTMPNGARLSRCFDLWRDFCIHQFLTQSLEFLLYSILEELDENDNNLEINELCKRLINDNFIENVDGCKSPSEYLKSFGFTSEPTQKQCIEMQEQYSLINGNGKSEIEIISNTNNSENKTPSLYAAKSIHLLIMLYIKWRSITNLPYRQTIDPGNNLCIDNILPFLDKPIFNPDTTWHNLLKEIINRFIILQHRAVIFEKKRLDSVWFRTENNRMIKEKDYFPQFRASRHYSAVKILEDLKLLDISENEISLTNDGEALLETLLKEEGKI